MKNKIHAKIKINMLFNKLLLFLIGAIFLVALFTVPTLEFFPIEKNDSLNVILLILKILVLTTFIVYPLFLLIFRIDERRINKTLNIRNISENELLIDYNSASKFGKTKIGELCTYTYNFYHYYIIPNSQILSVTKIIKTRQRNKVAKYKNGAIKRTRYNISTEQQYFLKIVDIHLRTILINCNKETTVDRIMRFYHKYPNILFLSIDNNTSKNKRLLQERRAQLLQEERSLSNEK